MSAVKGVNIGGTAFEVGQHAVHKAVSGRHEQDQHEDAPSDGEARQQGTQTVAAQGDHDFLPKVVCEDHSRGCFGLLDVGLPVDGVGVVGLYAFNDAIAQADDFLGALGNAFLVGDDEHGDAAVVHLAKNLHHFG